MAICGDSKCNGYLTDEPDNVLLATLAMLTHTSHSFGNLNSHKLITNERESLDLNSLQAASVITLPKLPF